MFFQSPPTRKNTFDIQKQLLQRLIFSYQNSPLYQNLWVKQDEQDQLITYNDQELKLFIAQFPFVEYKYHILPLLENNQWINELEYDLCIRTSGTSDANQWWKLIPTQWSSLFNESLWIKRTLSYYLKDNPESSLFFNKSFSLPASFDLRNNQWYISWAMRYYYRWLLWHLLFIPSQKILSIADRWDKKNAIITNLMINKEKIWSIHGVPTWPLEIIDDLIQKDRAIAKEVLSHLEYVSIWWWAPLDYKQQFQNKLSSLGIHKKIVWSNNHNASEWFLWSQIRNFFDLEYHWMSPMIQTNFFLFVAVEVFEAYSNRLLSYQDMIMQSSLLHEVESGKEYMMLFANDRIPRLYNIKDKVIFKDNSNEWSDYLLEYIVTGRYGMASNIFNEHIELNHLIEVFNRSKDEYDIDLDKNNFVAGMELCNNYWIFHIIIESSSPFQNHTISALIDQQLWAVNEQWKIFRQRGKIKELKLLCVPSGSIRKNLIAFGKMHEQSKIPHLSDKNYEHIIKPLLENIKKDSS